jgi:uncharacterized protein YbjT (DUF2867 family)
LFAEVAVKIVVIGGTGLIGSKLVTILGARGHEAMAASPSSGVNTVTGEGLVEALRGSDVVVDVSNSPSFEDGAALSFFEHSTRNLLAEATAEDVRHLVILSVVGTDRLQQSGYFRAKLVQEEMIEASSLPYSIVRSTQFFEFLDRISKSGGATDDLRLSPALIQPIQSDDVAAALADVATAPAIDGIIEIAGPDAKGLSESKTGKSGISARCSTTIR